MEQTIKTGTPVNTKSLMAFLCNIMVKLDEGHIDWQTANSQSKLLARAQGLLEYELKRTMVQIRLNELHNGINYKEPRLREIESKVFDDTI